MDYMPLMKMRTRVALIVVMALLTIRWGEQALYQPNWHGIVLWVAGMVFIGSDVITLWTEAKFRIKRLFRSLHEL